MPPAGGIVAALSRPDAYPGGGPVEVLETHISWVFLSADSAYKLKKPLVLPYVDYGTRERRRRMCLEEVRLNRRLAPSLYRGVRAVVPAGDGVRLAGPDDPEAVEHVVEMRRFDHRRTLAAAVGRGEAGEEEIEAVAARIAEFHGDAPPVLTRGDPVTALRAAAQESFRTLYELGAPRGRLTAAERFTSAFLAARECSVRARARAGLVRDGHGDLRAEHVLLESPIEIIDCVEFDPALRQVDVGADLSFLAMDLERLGAPELADTLVRSYAAHGGDPGDRTLVAFHSAQRAWVRAKVALLRARQAQGRPEEAAAALREATELLALGRRLSWRARGPLLLAVCGLSATGKSTLAGELAAATGAEVVSSDVVRKRLAGIATGERARSEHYSDEFSRRTYAELGRLAEAAMRRTGLVLVDATFRRAPDRGAFAGELGGAAADLRFVECVAPRGVLAERAAIRARQPGEASDATPAVVRAQRFEPLTEATPDRHLIVRGDRPVEQVAGDVEAWLDSRMVSPG